MSEQKGGGFNGGRVDSFFIETRVHGCENIMCPYNMASVIPGDRGKHCRYKKITIGVHGVCKDYQEAQKAALLTPATEGGVK